MKTKNHITAISISLSALFCTNTLAFPVQADRPGFSTGTHTISPGSINIEAGVQSSWNPDELTVPLLNIRTGITSAAEINIMFDGWTVNKDKTGTETNNLYIGTKHQIFRKNQYNVSLLASLSFPATGNSDSKKIIPLAGLLWDYEIGNNTTLFGTVQFTSTIENDLRYNNLQPAVGLSFSHNKKLSTYIEYYRDMPINLNTEDTDSAEAGITYLLTNDIQIDISIGLSIDRQSTDFIGSGLSVRIP